MLLVLLLPTRHKNICPHNHLISWHCPHIKHNYHAHFCDLSQFRIGYKSFANSQEEKQQKETLWLRLLRKELTQHGERQLQMGRTVMQLIGFCNLES